MEALLKYLYRVDLDLTGLCNRHCGFCPRASKQYPNVNKAMSWEVLEEVVEELTAINFKGFIELAGRGEPTLHPEFEKVVEFLTLETRPWKVRVTTNGYRLKRHWKGAYKLIDELILNTYTTEEESINRKRIYKKLANGTDVEHYFKPDKLSVQEINALPAVEDPRNPSKYFHYAFNNRAGWFSNKTLDKPCWHPMRQIFINYEGDYQMCCNDWTYQIKIGNILERSLMDMYINDPKLNRIRWSLLNNRRQDILPCSKCDDIQGGLSNTVGIIDRFKTTQAYKFHVCAIAGAEGAKYRKELSAEDMITVYEVD